MAIPKVQQKTPFDILQKIHGDLLVQIGKAFKTASREGKSGDTQSKFIKAKFNASYEAFNAALDDMECEILQMKSVIQRDLNQHRARRRPPQPEQQTVAPPAPMLVDLESLGSPTMFKASPSMGGPVSHAPAAAFQGQNRPGKQDNKPVAPFPNMGGPFDLTGSPEVASAPVPSPRTVPKKEPKPSPRPALVSGATGKLPPKKETKVYPPIPPTANRAAAAANSAAQARASAAAGQSAPAMVMKSTTPIPIPTMPGQIPTPSPVPSAVPVPTLPKPSVPTPVPIPVPAAAAAPAQTPIQPPAPPAPIPPAPAESIFTDMAFSVAPPSSDGPNMSQPQEMDLTDLDASNFSMDNFNGGGNSSGPADVANMDLGGSDGDVDAKIDGLFDLGGNDMDMDFDLDAGDNSNFNDMFFGNGDDNMGSGEFGNNFFEL
ncbi:hypothetical protein B0T16DRAFT_458072 [Cercophora newfieldiana]|uniref:Uncharacterized protein n=1 Tax=Cercophora newfieldiana TaxID=92897 RepID=A0AA40CPQ4_9PEZI|nr:hypothetical protein B0T16DRAFT_458072 [Cercophora newfieldiana]